jgi:hypothetical protein
MEATDQDARRFYLETLGYSEGALGAATLEIRFKGWLPGGMKWWSTYYADSSGTFTGRIYSPTDGMMSFEPDGNEEEPELAPESVEAEETFRRAATALLAAFRAEGHPTPEEAVKAALAEVLR